jgi:hypothetical protein
MNSYMKVLSVELDSDDGLLVTFSDGTIAGYVVEELLEMRPHRERASHSPVNVEWARTEPRKPHGRTSAPPTGAAPGHPA